MKDDEFLDVRDQIDSAPFSRYQVMLVCLCFLATFVDGFDTQAIAVAAPYMREHLAFQAAELGTIFATGTAGGTVAALSMAPFVDRIGRRPLILWTIFVSSILTFAHAHSVTFAQLVALRFAAGFCLAVAITAIYSYAAELAPRRAMATVVMVTSAGFGLGVAATGFVSGPLILSFGWKAIFYFGGGISLFAFVVLLFCLPESVRFMALRGGRDRQIRRFLLAIQPQRVIAPHMRFILDEENRPGLAFRHVLSEGRMAICLWTWLGFFCITFVIYVLMQWLPSFVVSAGGDVVQAGTAIAWFKLGAIVGSLVCANYIDTHRNPYPIIAVFLLLSSVALLAIATSKLHGVVFIVVICLTGLLLSGPQYATNGLMSRLFPTYVRGGGMALTAAVGRGGAMAGPFAIGLLLQAGWTERALLTAIIGPTLLASLILGGLAIRERRRAPATIEAAVSMPPR